MIKPFSETFSARRLAGSASLFALLVAGASPAFAQDQEDEQDSEQAEDAAVSEENMIVISGFRGAVVNALETKRELGFIADVISSDDIAGLPDVSIAESLARLPGVTSQRTGGQASAINIRGLSQDLVSASLNGREQVATSGNRIIEFDQYPSELISQAAVYKTPVASIIEGGVAGRVELQTARPLENREQFKGSVNIRGLYNDRADQNPDVGEYGYRVSASIQAKLANDTLGIALGYSRLYQPNVATRFVQFDFPSPGNNGSPVIDLDGNGNPDSLNFGFEAIQFGGREERDGLIGVIQYEPVPELRLLIDGYYSKFDSNVFRRGYRAFGTQSGNNTFTNPVIVNDAFVGGIITNTQGGGAGIELVNQDEGREDELYTIGGNLAYDLTDRFTAAVDVSYSRGTSFFNNSGVNLRPYETVPVTANNPRGLQRTDSLPGLIRIDYLLNGLNLPTINSISEDPTNVGLGGGGFLLDGQFLVPQRDTDELFAVALDFDWDLNNKFFSSVEFGARYSIRNGSRTITSFETFAIPGGPLAVPADLVQIRGFEGGFARAGFQDFAVVDVGRAFDFAFGGDRGTNQITSQDVFDFTIDQSFDIDEDILAGYFQLNMDGTAGGLGVRGNIGLRLVYTDQSSTVFLQDPSNPVNDPNDTRDNRIFVTNGDDYVDVLPSANLIIDLSPKDLLRLSYTRQLSRPRFIDLNGAIRVNTGADGNTSGSGGNPTLRPFRANQFDLSYEHYFDDDGVFAIAVYYKDLESFIVGGSIPDFDFVAAGLVPPPIPGTSIPGNAVGSFSTPINGDGGNVFGIEVNFTYSFADLLPAPLDGFGVVLNYAYSESNLSFPSATSGQAINLPLPGLSESVANPTIYYEKSGFTARVGMRYRTSFVAPQIGISELIVTNASETVFDGQIAYEFPDSSALDGLKLLFQVNNFTDEPTRSFFGQTAQTGTLQFFGRTFFLGATFEF